MGRWTEFGRGILAVENLDDHEALAESLMSPERWPEGGANRLRIDTHISTVILAGEHAYKIKKPVDFGFLNFLDLDERHRYCQEELRLNRRLAPQIYLAVAAVTGSVASPHIDGKGEPIDWAVKMRRFDPDSLLSNPRTALTNELIMELAKRVATFHQGAETASGGSLGTPEQAYTAMRGNFDALRQHDKFTPELETLENWSEAQFSQLQPIMAQRLEEQHVRECHGDLHLGNIALVDDQPLVFDAIEFNPAFRWIDTISDVAFLTMDLRHRGRTDLAHVFLDCYLEHSGDYAALCLLRIYEVYRALVRAKVAAIRQQQPEVSAQEQETLEKELHRYVELAGHIAKSSQPGIVITSGVSGSGKSRVTRDLPAKLSAIRVRSDVERKRLLNIRPEDSATEAGGYSEQVTERTYARLEQLAQLIIDAGYLAVVDATFLKREQRTRFRKLAERNKVPFFIVACDAPTELLCERIESRSHKSGNVSDADLQILQMQQESLEPLDENERACRITKPVSEQSIAKQLAQRLKETST